MLLVEFSSREDLDDIQHSYTFSLEGTSKVLGGIQAQNTNLPVFVDHNRCVELPLCSSQKVCAYRGFHYTNSSTPEFWFGHPPLMFTRSATEKLGSTGRKRLLKAYIEWAVVCPCAAKLWTLTRQHLPADMFGSVCGIQLPVFSQLNNKHAWGRPPTLAQLSPRRWLQEMSVVR